MDTAADRGGPPQGAYSGTPAAGGGPRAEAQEQGAPFLEPVERVYSSVKRMVSSYATLAVLDLRRATVQFAWLVAGGIVISVLAVTAWLAAVVALAVWLLGNGLSWPAVLLIAGGVNLVGAAIFALRLRGLFRQVPFEATLRELKSDSPEAESNGK